MRLMSRRPFSRKPLAARSIAEVMSVSAGPPLGGLYLKPPSSGGLCDGVTTTPSARPGDRPRVETRIAGRTPGAAGRRWVWGVAVPAVDERGDVVGREHLQRGDHRGLAQGVRVAAHEKRAVGA